MTELRSRVVLIMEAKHTGFLEGLRLAVDLSNKMLSQTKEKKLYRLELIRLMNEPARLLPNQKPRISNNHTGGING